MAAATEANPGLSIDSPGYDASGHQKNVLLHLTNITTDSSVTPNVTYGDLVASVTVSPAADLQATGTISAAQPVINTPVSNATVVLTLGTGQSTWKAQLLAGGGGFTSGTTIVADKSPDGGTTWYAASFKVAGASPATSVTSVVGPGPLELTGNAAGATKVRLRCSVLNGAETIAVTLDASTGVSEVSLLGSIPGGTNKIGGVTIADGDLTTLGALADAAYTDGTGAASGTSQGLFKGIFVKLAAIATSVAGVLQIKRSTVAVYSLASITTSGSTQNSGDLTVGPYTELSIDINTTAQAGTSPTIQYFYERKAADGIYYVLWQSAVLTAATNTLSTSIGAGLAYNQSLGATGRLRWVVGGSATPTFTHTANLQAK